MIDRPDEHDPPPQPLDHSILIGARLRQAREERNLSLSQMAEKTRIRRTYLECIEEGRMNGLPGTVYAAGFLRTYARLLDVEIDELAPPSPDKPKSTVADQHLDFPQPPPEHNRTWVIVGVSLALFIALVIAWGSSQRAWLQDVVNLLPDWAGDPPQITTPLEAASQIQITATAQGWLQLRDQDLALITTRVLQPGDVYSYPYARGLRLTISDPAVVEITVRGKALALTAPAGQIARNISLDAPPS